MIQRKGEIMQKFKGMMTSIHPNWSTPKWLYDELNKEFHFDFDPCPLNDNPVFDGLSIEWKQRNYINPPYGRQIGNWIRKAYQESISGKLCVMLLPSRTDTKWFHESILPYAKEIRFIKGRLKFGNATNSAPFPSMITIFKGE